MGRVTFAMSKTILKTDGMVLPIGGKVCKPCKDAYVRQYIPALTSIKDFKPFTEKVITKPSDEIVPTNTSSKSPEENVTPLPTTEEPPLTNPENLEFSFSISQDEIQQRLSTLTPVPAIETPPLPTQASPSPPSPTPLSSSPPTTTTSVSIVVAQPETVIEDISVPVVQAEDITEDPGSGTIIVTVSNDSALLDIDNLSQMNDDDDDDDDNLETESASDTQEEMRQDQDEYKYYCKLCHIGFLKETSYKYHLTNNVELHKKAKTQKNKVKKCDECGKSFSNDNLFRKHMYKEHRMDDPHYCKICHIVLKSESAYKSHYSKLHLERRTKIFYCRECGDIFSCKLKHKEHIR